MQFLSCLLTRTFREESKFNSFSKTAGGFITLGFILAFLSPSFVYAEPQKQMPNMEKQSETDARIPGEERKDGSGRKHRVITTAFPDDMSAKHRAEGKKQKKQNRQLQLEHSDVDVLVDGRDSLKQDGKKKGKKKKGKKQALANDAS